MNRKIIALVSAAVIAVLAFGGVAVAGGLDDEQPITGEALEQASAAALEHLGGGEVTETEVGDEESMYEVEVTLPDGSEVDVQLDEDFTVVADEADEDDDEDEDEDADE